MAELKTQPNDDSVQAFLDGIEDGQKREDSFRLLEMLSVASGQPARMWGSSIVGFGAYHYVYDSGREGDWFEVGFSPRKQNLTVYIMPGFERYDELLNKLGKHSTGKSCLYIKRLADVDENALRRLIDLSVRHIRGAG